MSSKIEYVNCKYNDGVQCEKRLHKDGTPCATCGFSPNVEKERKSDIPDGIRNKRRSDVIINGIEYRCRNCTKWHQERCPMVGRNQLGMMVNKAPQDGFCYAFEDRYK
ncbi:MAG: hypothetical protein MJY95_08320 [Bacteroidaceae bacterium]|nr:hypothetical protein [Bacteroidaceae bacterium]